MTTTAQRELGRILSDDERERIWADAYVAEMRRQDGPHLRRAVAARRAAKQALREAIAAAARGEKP